MTWLLDPRQKRHFMHLNLKATFYNLALKVLQSCNEVTTLCRFSNRGKGTNFYLIYKSLVIFHLQSHCVQKMTVIIETTNGQIMKSMRNSLSKEQQSKH